MAPEQSLEQRLSEVEALLKSLVIRVTELELLSTPTTPSPRPEAPSAPASAPAPAPTRAAPGPRKQFAAPPPAQPTPRPATPLAPRAAPAAPPPAAARPAPPASPPRPPAPPRRTLGELARDWDLVGARGFAIAGGAVTAFGIGLFFVLAANRGWIDAGARVALGATASALVFGAGLLLRARFGQYWSALAAVGAGIAGAYATLAAAAARYDLVPDALALPLAGVIAGVGTTVAVRWRSQVIAAIGLLGAALAPALQALDTDLTWESAAFAVIVLAATVSVAVLLAWRELLVATSVVVAAQVEWLAAEAARSPGAGTIVVASALVLTLLGAGLGWQLRHGRGELDPLALGYATASFGASLILTLQLLDHSGDRGTAFLVAAAVWALVATGLHLRRQPDLGFVVGVSALSLAGVGTAYLFLGATLTVVWAAQSLVLTLVAWRLRDARVRLTSFVYAVLASGYALGTDGELRLLFDEGADHAGAIVPLAAAAVAAGAAGLLTPTTYVPRTETGLLAFLGDLRRGLETHRTGIVELLSYGGAAQGTLALSFALTAVSFERGHVLASLAAAAVGAGILATAARRRSLGLAIASYAWLGLVLGEALGFDVDRFYGEEDELSSGGWSVLAAAAGLLAGAYAHRVLERGRRREEVLFGIAAGVAAACTPIGVGLLVGGVQAFGAGLLVAAGVYTALAGAIFGREGLRDASTILWSFALLLLVGAESAVVTDAVWRTVAVALTGLAVGAVALPLRELRLWLGASALVTATTAIGLFVQVEPWLDEGEIALRLALASGACAVAAVGLAALVWSRERWRDLAVAVGAVGVLAVLATERVLLDDWELTAFAFALTAALLALLERPLGEWRVWLGGAVLTGATTWAVVSILTPPSHFFTESESPAASLWVLLACVAALGVLALTAREGYDAARKLAAELTGAFTLYAVSLGILEFAIRLSPSAETGFERGHTAVSVVWALIGLALLLGGLARGVPTLRYAGLALFGLSLAKIFLYDLAELSSVARAFSFILVGALLLVGGFFLQRLSDRLGPRSE